MSTKTKKPVSVCISCEQPVVYDSHSKSFICWNVIDHSYTLHISGKPHQVEQTKECKRYGLLTRATKEV
jgi:hypothetical protein